MSVKVSVIIPVYNAEKYIVECIESLLNQTMKECEFIFVNDGSKDESENLIKQYLQIDNRIILINQDNQGVSSARNKGIEAATGEYIGFVDADDYILKDMYYTLYFVAKEFSSDIVISNFESILDGQQIITRYPFAKEKLLNSKYIKDEVIPYFMQSDNLNAIWSKLYKRKVIMDKKIRFPSELTWGEDAFFNISFFCNAKNMVYKDYAGYHYREIIGSATRNVLEVDYFQKILEVYRMEHHEVSNLINNDGKLKKLKSKKLINSIISMVHIYSDPKNIDSLLMRLSYVKNMVSNKFVREALELYHLDENKHIGKYERLLLFFIRKELSTFILILTSYSRYKNRNKEVPNENSNVRTRRKFKQGM